MIRPARPKEQKKPPRSRTRRLFVTSWFVLIHPERIEGRLIDRGRPPTAFGLRSRLCRKCLPKRVVKLGFSNGLNYSYRFDSVVGRRFSDTRLWIRLRVARLDRNHSHHRFDSVFARSPVSARVTDVKGQWSVAPGTCDFFRAVRSQRTRATRRSPKKAGTPLRIEKAAKSLTRRLFVRS